MAKKRRALASLSCVPCHGGIPPLEAIKIQGMLVLVPGWILKKDDIDKIEKKFVFNDFSESMTFVNKVAEIAEKEDHHPDIFIHWNEVTLTIWTHAIEGLFDNDFIIAAKINEIMNSPE